MRSRTFVAIATVVAVLPSVVLAQSSSSGPVSSLMSEISQLEQQITSLTANTGSVPAPSTTATTVPVQPTTSAYTSSCPYLWQTLGLGSTGSDVTSLQTFLAEQGLFNASATGYFGAVTQSAVETWQASHGIISGGTPATTGFGVVGPRTRAAMLSSCGGTNAGGGSVVMPSTPGSCLPAQPPTTDCPTSWKPVLDGNGCTEYYQCSISLPGAASQSSTSTATGSNACPVVQKPICSGQVVPFQTNSNGCVTSYECVL